jgi:16S rRNA (adenine1518-N6/adenine1519-N6)-dimethyltransferase
MVDDEEAFFRLVKAGFSQKRKQLKNNLRTLSYKPDEIEEALAKAGVDGRRRAETLSLAEWVAIYQAF